ncbi:hypothetical protein F2P81_012614 [Scophthalmus maximus]|uniref:Spondin-like TSP1 domain-containing protein n=1 Tax=Scophthalmus maximus TaxID=52904 RepID=A0A6A4SI62_SCOMX|nr:hypothetical protein F2P81_012614 [Scophthalmus maximus]
MQNFSVGAEKLLVTYDDIMDERRLVAVSCAVSEWTERCGCAEPCRATVRRRSRVVVQEPLNAGTPCPHLEEHAGCAEYWSTRGHCPSALVPELSSGEMRVNNSKSKCKVI